MRSGFSGMLRLWRGLSAPALFVASFAVLILLGTLGLLVLPGIYQGPRLDALDALFTMTSAVCVTGLIVVDTATYFTIWGQAWILLFVQLGGLGLMTLSTVIMGALGRRLSLRAEMTGVSRVPGLQEQGFRELTLAVVRFTFLIEGMGVLVLLALWIPRFGLRAGFWHALFQSVSAFCNAGFSTFSDSMVEFDRSVPTLLTMSMLIILGGLGFLSVGEILQWRRSRARRRRLSMHTFAVLVTTAVLLVGGTAGYLLFESDGALLGLAWTDRLVNAWFMATTARTAGFNSVPYTALGNDAAFLTMLLMFVGGSPGSTAGGVKTTTLTVLVASAWSRIRGRRFVELHGRGIPRGTLERTVTLILLAVAVLTAAFFAFSLIEHGDASLHARREFLPLAFETVSAFATVGLSMGMTTHLSPVSRVLLILLMFIGRVGLLSFFAAVTMRGGRTTVAYRPAEEDLLVG